MHLMAALLLTSALGDPLLEDAARAGLDYLRTLPDFLCRQKVTREIRPMRVSSWMPMDTIDVEVTFERGQEAYRSLRKDGKPVEEAQLTRGGWTKGEWGTALIHIFQPKSHALFQPAGTFKIKGVTGRKFTVHIEEESSRWHVQDGPAEFYPAYHGTLWIEENSHRVVRLEIDAPLFPADFPLEWVHLEVDYGWVAIGDKKHLLPVRSLTYYQQRHARLWRQQKVTFLNYRKFEADSRLLPAR